MSTCILYILNAYIIVERFMPMSSSACRHDIFEIIVTFFYLSDCRFSRFLRYCTWHLTHDVCMWRYVLTFYYAFINSKHFINYFYYNNCDISGFILPWAILQPIFFLISGHQCRPLLAILEMLKWFAGSQIRNVAVCIRWRSCCKIFFIRFLLFSRWEATSLQPVRFLIWIHFWSPVEQSFTSLTPVSRVERIVAGRRSIYWVINYTEVVFIFLMGN